MATPDPAVEGVKSVLLRLRTHAGLTVERLGSTEVDTSVLANLDAVRRATTTGLAADAAIVQVVTRLVGQLDTTDLLIADAVLALGVVRARVGDQPALDNLYADELGDRREALVDGWAELHALLGVTTAPKKPTVRSLRGTIEARTLGVLATRCVATAETATAPAQVVLADRGDGAKSIVIVGGAVMDHIFMVGQIPKPNTSANALNFQEHPGGKGLNLAVAGTRMGLDTRLISAIGDDQDADRILAYMRSVGARTDLVKEVPATRTPVTGVIVTEEGDSSAVGWTNAAHASRAESELLSLRPALARADAVLVTFEPTPEEVLWALETTSKQEHKPLLLVQPSPPTDRPQRLYRYMSSVDYLIGSEWELRSLLPLVGPEEEFDNVAHQLLNLGVKAVCAVEQLTCRIRSMEITADIPAPIVPRNDTPGAREAFSAALIYQLLEIGRNLNTETLQWATTAMAIPKLPVDEITESMPVPDDVDRLRDIDKIRSK
jgi:ribokinase